jgi:NAD-dependent deacetylase
MLENENIETLIRSSSYPVFYIGNGLSFLSGVPINSEMLFGYQIIDILNIEFYNNKRDTFNKAIKDIYKWTKLEPNIAHIKLANWECPIITETIDGLLQKSGCKNVIELHGSLHSLKCEFCNEFHEEISTENKDKRCRKCKKTSSQNLVLSGQSINNFHIALNEIYRADILIVIGSQLIEWPANKLVKKAMGNDCKILNIYDPKNILSFFNKFIN